MTQIDFYILPATTLEERLNFTCKLVNKAYRLGRQVYIATDNRDHAEQLDKLLWSFQPDSFIPHSIHTEGTPIRETVVIGTNTQGGDHHDLLINLCQNTPKYFSRFQRLAEIVIQKDNILQETRKNFKFYRERGYPINSHDLRN